MPYELYIPAQFSARWKVKIRDKERSEPPHVTIMRGTKAWRIALRDWTFMDEHPSPREVPRALVEHVMSNKEALVREWNKMYPRNPV